MLASAARHSAPVPTRQPLPGPPCRPRGVLALAALALLAGCASYPSRTAGALGAFQRGHLEQALALYEDPDTTGTPFLAGAEAGMVALAMGEWRQAQEHLHLAAEASEEVLGRGTLEPGRLVESLASFGLNDTTQAYGGEGFERVTVHAALAMTYLALGELDGVWVEVQRANQLLEGEEELYEKEYRAGGFGHLISAVAYELFGELDQAAIDYERMVAKDVGTEIAGKALVRISSELGRKDELERWSERFGADAPRPEGAASVVVLAGVGLGGYKVEGSLAFPSGKNVFAMAVPSYQTRPQQVSELALTLADEPGGGEAPGVRTAVVESVSTVAAENLSDRLALIAAKSIARGLAKRELADHLGDEYGEGARLVGNLFTILSERADLRSWQTLPDTWQAARLFVPPGVHTLELTAIGGERLRLGSFELEPGETMVVIARSVGPRLFAHPIGGRPVGDTTATAPEHGEAANLP